MNIQTPANTTAHKTSSYGRTLKHTLLGALMMTAGASVATTSVAGETAAAQKNTTSPTPSARIQNAGTF